MQHKNHRFIFIDDYLFRMLNIPQERNLQKELAKKAFGNVLITGYGFTPKDKKFDCIIGNILLDIDAKFLKDYIKLKKKRLLKENGIILIMSGRFF